MKEFHIAFAADDGYVLQICVAICSCVAACTNESGVPVVHVLDCGISNESWMCLRDRIECFARKIGRRSLLHRHEIDMSRFAAYSQWHTSRATYARLLLPELLPNVDECIYSDGDILFFRNPMRILEELREKDVSIVGHKNPCDLDLRWFESRHLNMEGESYFCAGLIGMNLRRFRECRGAEKALEFLDRYPDVIAPDQCALNWVFKDSRALLSDGWGIFADEIGCDRGKVGAIHFVGGGPWKDFSWYEFAMWRDLNDLWRLFCRSVVGVGAIATRRTLMNALIGCAVCGVAHLFFLMHVEVPLRPSFMLNYRKRQKRKKTMLLLKARLCEELVL